ncbi:MAG: hypothetical protein ACXAE3_17945 [Candidatus Kariarchaeaceae archaeon]
MKETDNLDELYEWVNSLYEKYSNGEVPEEEYMEAYNFYIKRKEEMESEPVPNVQNVDDEEVSVSPEKVRSTSIAGLRKKLMEEMKK